MDILSILPKEIAELILSQLPASDLWTCLSVSRTWRYISNQKKLWHPHCVQVGVPVSYIPLEEIQEDYLLCKPAMIWSIRSQSMMADHWKYRQIIC